MAKKAKGNRVQVILECTEHKASGMPGTSRLPDLVAPAFNPSTQEAEAGRFLSSRPAWSTE